MLKHILTGQPATASRHHSDFSSASGLASNGTILHQHQHVQQDHHQQSQQQQHENHHLHHHHVHQQQFAARGARFGSVDVYDSIGHQSQRPLHPATTTPSSSHNILNHSQLNVNNLSQRLNHSHTLNLSTLSTSKHSVDSVSPVIGNNASHIQVTSEREHSKVNGGLDILRLSRLPSHTTPSPVPVPGDLGIVGGPSIVPLNTSLALSMSQHNKHQEVGVKEMLTSLGLLCLVSLLLALLSLIFLLKISPLTVTPSSLIRPEDYAIVYEVTLALCALALSLNLCCLLVCAIQFLFAVKLVKTSYQGHRTNKYLQKSSISRVCAVGGFFISIPVFLTGMILYTFIQFHSTPAIVTSVFMGLGIIFCGCAMVHNVFVWQREKTNAIKALAREQCEAAAQLQRQQMQQRQQLRHTGQVQGNQISLHGSGGQKSDSHHQTHLTATMSSHSREQQYHSHQLHHHHVSMSSPPLSLSSPVPVSGTHKHHQLSSMHRNIVTPPMPEDPSSPSPPGHKNKSHTISHEVSRSISPGLPAATLDLSSATTTNSPHELSTLV